MTTQLNMPEWRALLRSVASDGKTGALTRGQLEDLIQRSTALESRDDRVSVLRFALRLTRRGGFAPGPIVQALRAEYAAGAADESLPDIARAKLLEWRNRYGEATVDRKTDGYRRCFEGTLDQLAGFVSLGDWDFSFDRRQNTLECRSENGSLFRVAEGAWAPFTGTVIGQMKHGTFQLEGQAWTCGGKTHIGYTDSNRKNDDAVAACPNGRGEYLLAVADGTGDSQFGSRASTLGLQGLLDAWAAGVDLATAVRLAASKVRADNCAHVLDGTCTLAACILKDESAELIAVGDAFFLCADIEGRVHQSVFDKEHRAVLGGEALGVTITSSGRIVENLNHESGLESVLIDHPRVILLGSDGVCTPGLLESLSELSRIILGSEGPLELVDAALDRAHMRFSSHGGYDNISAVAAVRTER